MSYLFIGDTPEETVVDVMNPLPEVAKTLSLQMAIL